MGEPGAEWLGLEATDQPGVSTLKVGPGVTSGAGALFGGCATAAALVAAGRLTDQPIFWAGVHFGRLAGAGATIQLSSRVLAAGRTLTHLAVEGTAEGKEVFSARLSAGRRDPATLEGAWIAAPVATGPEVSPAFELPVHINTWAERFDWRLPELAPVAGRPVAAWWVRAQDPAMDPGVVLAVLADYVTYGVGRALGSPMGGLSIDNTLRIHARDLSDWLLLAVRPEAVAEGIGSGAAYLYDSDRRLLACGSQNMVMNDWDWRLPSETDANEVRS